MSSVEPNKSPSATEQWITFEVGNGTYVLPIGSVEEIIHYDPPTPVPDAPAEVEGLLNVRGSLVTVISGHTLLNLQRENPTQERRIIILGTEEGLVGISVDVVDDIVSFDAGDVEMSQGENACKAIKGTVMHQDRLLILLDLNDTLTRHDKPD